MCKISVHWTSARDANSHRQFTWNETGKALLTELPLNMNNIGYLTCLSYDFEHRYLKAHPCYRPLGTLCETF